MTIEEIEKIFNRITTIERSHEKIAAKAYQLVIKEIIESLVPAEQSEKLAFTEKSILVQSKFAYFKAIDPTENMTLNIDVQAISRDKEVAEFWIETIIYIAEIIKYIITHIDELDSKTITILGNTRNAELRIQELLALAEITRKHYEEKGYIGINLSLIPYFKKLIKMADKINLGSEVFEQFTKEYDPAVLILTELHNDYKTLSESLLYESDLQ